MAYTASVSGSNRVISNIYGVTMPKPTPWVQINEDGTRIRLCPGCGQPKLWDPADGGEWYNRLVERGPRGHKRTYTAPSQYCRDCTKGRRVAHRARVAAVKAAGDDPVALLAALDGSWGTCAVCGRTAAKRAATGGALMCQACAARWRVCGGEVNIAEVYWRVLRDHCAREDEHKAVWEERNPSVDLGHGVVRAGRRYPWHIHEGNRGVDHLTQCLPQRDGWEAMVDWLVDADDPPD